ncbi:hypothetical protein IJG93_00020 [Candidatus Saccharibacteria bacterium]|nr:hypothetical protein [Candidatus Saccharibacteria bacterium]
MPVPDIVQAMGTVMDTSSVTDSSAKAPFEVNDKNERDVKLVRKILANIYIYIYES